MACDRAQYPCPGPDTNIYFHSLPTPPRPDLAPPGALSQWWITTAGLTPVMLDAIPIPPPAWGLNRISWTS